jgi:ferric-dicitrate binding protein FerR (iron transport regulator)
MSESIQSELLARYFASEADATQRAAVEAWAAESAANAAELQRLRSAWEAKRPGQWDVDRAWSKVGQRLDDSAPVVPIGEGRMDREASAQGRTAREASGQRRWDREPIVRIAAAVVLVAGLAFGWRQISLSRSSEPELFATAVGERRSLDLTDGTHVVLGPSSELRVDGAYNRQGRRVDLSGEAWFEVHHDANQTFQVHAGGTVTEDLGTSFSVRALPGESLVRVVVVEGSAGVSLESATPGPRATLRARDAAEIDVRTARVNFRRDTNVEAMVAWRLGRVEFSDTRLGEVAAELKRWYGVSMRFATPEIVSRSVSYSMPTNDLTEATDVLGRLLGVTIERKGDTLFVR